MSLKAISYIAFVLERGFCTNILTVSGLDLFVEMPPHDIRQMTLATSSRTISVNHADPFIPTRLSIDVGQEDPLIVPLYDSPLIEFAPTIHFTPDFLAADFGSDLSTAVDVLILVPSGSLPAVQMHNVLNYADVCVDGTPGFVNVRRVANPETLSKIRVRFSVNGEYTAPTFSDFAIDTLAPSSMDAVPENVFEGFKSVLQNYGVEVTDEHTIDCNMRHQLPDVTYTIATGSDTPVVNIVLTPDDYIGESEFGFCLLMIRPSESGEFALGPNLIKRVAIIFDYTNEQVGFCEPVQ